MFATTHVEDTFLLLLQSIRCEGMWMWTSSWREALDFTYRCISIYRRSEVGGWREGTKAVYLYSKVMFCNIWITYDGCCDYDDNNDKDKKR